MLSSLELSYWIFYMENTLVRSEFSKEPCSTCCYDGTAVTRGSCWGEQKCAEGRASLLLPALLLQPHALLTLSFVHIRNLGFSKHLPVFISAERFVGLLCKSSCIFSFLTSGAGMLYSVQSI